MYLVMYLMWKYFSIIYDPNVKRILEIFFSFIISWRKKEKFVSRFHILFNIRSEMVSFEDRYYNVNRKLLVITGLWPYQKWKFRIIQITLFLSILISFLMAQVCRIVFALIWFHNSRIRASLAKLNLQDGHSIFPRKLNDIFLECFIFDKCKIKLL